jgi:selenide,water dikinase
VSGRFRGAGRLGDLDLTVVEQADTLLPGFPSGLQAYAADRLRRRGATIRRGTTVEAVRRDGDRSVVDTSDAPLTADAVLWATGTVGPSFLRESGLATDDRGFLYVGPTLRVPTHPRVFAAGDCATLLHRSLAKVGVHAVKQGADLRANLDRTVRRLDREGTLPPATALTAFRPYPVAPLILSTGAPAGLWTAGPLWAAHPWLLRLKHAIDRRWIRDYAPEQWGGAGWRTLLGAEAASSRESEAASSHASEASSPAAGGGAP